MTNRELHIKEIFLPKQRSPKKTYLSEEQVLEIITFVSDLGRSIGFVGLNKSLDENKNNKRAHKFDVWIAKEIKKDLDLLNYEQKFRLIIDWVVETKFNIFSVSFKEAMELQNEWHKNVIKTLQISKFPIPDLDENRILYRCSDEKYFIYLLDLKDLNFEGTQMKNCISGSQYKQKLKIGTHFYVSLRDEKNQPHVSTEISTTSKRIIQILGKTNEKPKLEYLEKILEFILFYTNYKEISENEKTKIMNLNYLI